MYHVMFSLQGDQSLFTLPLWLLTPPTSLSKFPSLIYGLPLHFSSLFPFFFLWSFPSLFHFLQLLSIHSVHFIYQCSWKARNQSLGFSQAFSLLPEHLYCHLTICFPLHWKKYATVRFSTQLIKCFCLDTKQKRFATTNEFIFSLPDSEETEYLFSFSLSSSQSQFFF